MSKYPHLAQDPLNIHLLANFFWEYMEIYLLTEAAEKDMPAKEKEERSPPRKIFRDRPQNDGSTSSGGDLPNIPPGGDEKEPTAGTSVGTSSVEKDTPSKTGKRHIIGLKVCGKNSL